MLWARWIVIQPGFISIVLHPLVLKSTCKTYADNIGPKLKKLSFAIFGEENMVENKFYCILKNIHLVFVKIWDIFRFEPVVGPKFFDIFLLEVFLTNFMPLFGPISFY